MTHRVFCSFTNDEYQQIADQAKKAGMTISRFTEYAVLLHIDRPRSATISLAQMQNQINTFLKTFKGDSFYCNTPFGNLWTEMSTSDKRTAAYLMRKYKISGKIAVVQPASKSHRATLYRIV